MDSQLKRTAQNYSSTVSSGSGSSGNNSSDTTYPVTVSQPSFGTITVTPKNASKGDTVTITVQPEQGYQLESLKVTDNQGTRCLCLPRQEHHRIPLGGCLER